jgi:hypothetical protein
MEHHRPEGSSSASQNESTRLLQTRSAYLVAARSGDFLHRVGIMLEPNLQGEAILERAKAEMLEAEQRHI